MARAVAIALCGLLCCVGRPASALICEDPQSGTARESGTDSCLLGERQILPQDAGEGGVAPKPAAPRAVETSSPAPPAEGKVVSTAALPPHPPRPSPPRHRPSCLGPTAAVAKAEQTIRMHLGAVTFASGRVIINSVLGGTYSASLGTLDPAVVVQAEAGRARLTINCTAGNCWRVRRAGAVERSASASFPLDQDGQASPVGQALAKLIRQCRED